MPIGNRQIRGRMPFFGHRIRTGAGIKKDPHGFEIALVGYLPPVNEDRHIRSPYFNPGMPLQDILFKNPFDTKQTC